MRANKITIVFCLIVLLASFLIAGCGQIKEAYLFNHLIFARGTDPQELQAREIERQRIQFEDYLQTHPTQQEKDEHPGPGIPVLTIRY